MITWLLGFCLLASLLAIAALVLELRRVSSIYESMSTLLVQERDAAREDVKTLRAAIFPQLKRTANSESKGDQPATPVRVARPVNTDASILQRRVPWRIKFKQLTQQHAAHTPRPAAQENSHG